RPWTIGLMRSISSIWMPCGTDASRSGQGERFDPYRIAWSDVARVLLDDDQAVGLGHRREDAGALWAGGRHLPVGVAIREEPALEFPPSALLLHRLRRHRAKSRDVELAPPGELPQRGANEEVEGQHRRNRVAGQAEEVGALDPAHRHRTAGLHGHLPEIDAARVLE